MRTPGSPPFRRIAVLLAAALGTACLCSAQDRSYKDGVVAVVNSEIITVFDVALFALQGEQQIRSHVSREDLRNEGVRKDMIAEIEALRKEAANRLIDQKLIYAEFAGRGGTVPDELIEKRMDAIIGSPQFNGDVGKLEDYLESQETSLEEFRETITKNIAVSLLTSREVDRRINVTPQQVQQYYLENKDRLSRPNRVKMAMLEVRHARHADHKERIAAITTALAEGKDFAKLVEEASDGPNRSGGGDLGWMEVATMRPEFRNGLGTFQKDFVSAPIPLGGSTYFFKLLDTEATKAADLESMRPILQRQLRMQKRERRYKQWVESLRQKAYVRIFFK